MSDDNALGAGAILLGGGIFGFFWGLRTYLHRRLIEQTPTSKVQSAALGTVELAGQVPSQVDLASPLCQVACAWYRYEVEEERRDSKGRTHWSTVLKGISDRCFYLQDDTGCMLIDPTGADIDVPYDYRQILGGLFSDIPANIQQFMQSEGAATMTWWGGEKRMRFTEWRLEPGDPIFILGTLAERRDMASPSAVSHENLVVKKEGRYYLISNTSEKEELSRLFWRAFGGVVGGGVAAVVGLVILMSYFNIL